MYSRNRREIPASAARSLLGLIPGRSAFVWVVAFSMSLNILLLVVPFYAIEVFDRVITSGSVETLVGLTIIAAGALVFSAMFDVLRSRLLSRFAVGFERCVAPIVLESTIVDVARRGDGRTHDLVRVRELRTFLSSGTVAALIDAPFLPAFIFILFLMHPWYGVIALIGAVILLVMGIASRWVARTEVAQASEAALRTQATLDGIVRHSGLVRAMGWTRGAIREFMDLNDQALCPVVRGSERVSAIASAARMVRTILQVAAIGAGAWLVLQSEVLAGSLIASAILIARTLQPMEGLISAWRALASAHEAWVQVQAAAAPMLVRARRTLLPSPSGSIEVMRVTYRMATAQRPILAGITFGCLPSRIVVVIGPTGAGKSTLLRLMAGLERPSSGTIRLDDAALHDWDPDQLGQFVGYLPQDVQLLGGTVAEAIAGFDEHARDEDIVAAAMLAQAHEMILSLPAGYQTEIGRDGNKLSGGQRQRIGLARAFFGDRKLILLDEPNANLDPEGEEALCSAIERAKARGAAVVIVTHRPRLLTIADAVLLLRDGAQLAFGPPAEVLRLPVNSSVPKPHVVRHNPEPQKLAARGPVQ
ncbi:type I secretion system permease/ATPase [Bradyrhizobium sp. CSA112]|uniref:type I secretion system permease/ATPase n=1 Tax=Bradyrhizobium sp. CSA112 TaxID=2699170 RepID=UPI0023AEEEF0|nr:type I secretion system permease/ATPase [Bradyrhizobium sp. CSA112]MDE5458468.1 type I secretion system permease/ATPase [Bradyrhizobium sp. CSA112]